MLTAVEKTAEATLDLGKAIVTQMDGVRRIIQEQRPKIYSRELVETLFIHVYTRIDHLVERGVASRNVAGRYLKELESIGILESRRAGRGVFYINKQLFDLFKNYSNMH